VPFSFSDDLRIMDDPGGGEAEVLSLLKRERQRLVLVVLLEK